MHQEKSGLILQLQKLSLLLNLFSQPHRTDPINKKVETASILLGTGFRLSRRTALHLGRFIHQPTPHSQYTQFDLLHAPLPVGFRVAHAIGGPLSEIQVDWQRTLPSNKPCLRVQRSRYS